MATIDSIVDVRKIEQKIEEWSAPVRRIVEEYNAHFENKFLEFDFDWMIRVKEAASKLLKNINDYIEKQENVYSLFMSTFGDLEKTYEDISLEEFMIFHADTIRPLYYRKNDLEELIAEIDNLIT